MRRVSKFGPLVAILAILLTGGVATAGVTDIDVDQSNAVNHQRDTATIQGSIACDPADANIEVVVYVIQTKGTLLNIGMANSAVNCNTQQGNTFVGDLNVDVPTMEGVKFKPAGATVLVKAKDSNGVLSEKAFMTKLHPTNNP